MALAFSKSARALVAGSGSISNFITGYSSARVVFSQAQDFKEGATIYSSTYGTAYTVDRGYSTEWMLKQRGSATYPLGGTWYKSDPGTGRARGGSYALIVPRARHFLYGSPLDASGNADMYLYLDTLFPEKGVHPYTKDRYFGSLYAEPARVCPNLDYPIVGESVCPQCGRITGNADPTEQDQSVKSFFAALGDRLALIDSMSRVVG